MSMIYAVWFLQINTHEWYNWPCVEPNNFQLTLTWKWHQNSSHRHLCMVDLAARAVMPSEKCSHCHSTTKVEGAFFLPLVPEALQVESRTAWYGLIRPTCLYHQLPAAAYLYCFHDAKHVPDTGIATEIISSSGLPNKYGTASVEQKRAPGRMRNRKV